MILFVDPEASSLARRSFPVEVAWVDQDGHGESYLIRPADTLLSPEHGPLEWSPASERIHGISLATLLDEGTNHERVAHRAAQVMAQPQVVVCSNAPGFRRQLAGGTAYGCAHRRGCTHSRRAGGLRGGLPPAADPAPSRGCSWTLAGGAADAEHGGGNPREGRGGRGIAASGAATVPWRTPRACGGRGAPSGMRSRDVSPPRVHRDGGGSGGRNAHRQVRGPAGPG